MRTSIVVAIATVLAPAGLVSARSFERRNDHQQLQSGGHCVVLGSGSSDGEYHLRLGSCRDAVAFSYDCMSYLFSAASADRKMLCKYSSVIAVKIQRTQLFNGGLGLVPLIV